MRKGTEFELVSVCSHLSYTCPADRAEKSLGYSRKGMESVTINSGAYSRMLKEKKTQGQMSTFGNQFSPSTLWVPRIHLQTGRQVPSPPAGHRTPRSASALSSLQLSGPSESRHGAFLCFAPGTETGVVVSSLVSQLMKTRHGYHSFPAGLGECLSEFLKVFHKGFHREGPVTVPRRGASDSSRGSWLTLYLEKSCIFSQ